MRLPSYTLFLPRSPGLDTLLPGRDIMGEVCFGDRRGLSLLFLLSLFLLLIFMIVFFIPKTNCKVLIWVKYKWQLYEVVDPNGNIVFSSFEWWTVKDGGILPWAGQRHPKVPRD